MRHFFKRIGINGKLFAYEDDLIGKEEAELSASSSSLGHLKRKRKCRRFGRLKSLKRNLIIICCKLPHR
jgi:hypothetical protein